MVHYAFLQLPGRRNVLWRRTKHRRWWPQRCHVVSPTGQFCVVLTFRDASDMYYGSFLTEVPAEGVYHCVPVEDMAQEPPGFLSGDFRGAQQRCLHTCPIGYHPSTLHIDFRPPEGELASRGTGQPLEGHPASGGFWRDPPSFL